MPYRAPALVILLGLLSAFPVLADKAFETPPVLKASEIAPKGVPLKGERYVVDATVPTDGFLATFTIRSDFGRLQARGPGMLQVRIAEIKALAELNQMKTSDVFVESFKASAAALGNAVVDTVTDPVETARAAPAAVGRFFDRVTRQGKTALQKLDDARKSDSTQGVAVAAAGAAGRATRDAFGYDEKRRELAKRLGVDPYTTNPILTKDLDEVAWTAFAGGLAVDVLASNVPGGTLAKSSHMLSDWIYETPPGDLKVWIDNTLRQIGVKQETIDLFLRHKAYTLTLQTTLVLALEKLKGAQGRPEVIATAVTAENIDQARFLATGLSLLAREHEKTPIKRIVDGRPIGLTADGRILVTAPVDYVAWTQRAASFASRGDFVRNRPILKLTGSLSPRARDEIKKLGWQIQENLLLTAEL